MIFSILSSFINIITNKRMNFNKKKKNIHYSIDIDEHFQLEGYPNLNRAQNIIDNGYHFIVILKKFQYHINNPINKL